MAYENKPWTGALFKNDKKQTDSHPDYTGPFYDADGKEMRIAVWLKTANSGSKYMSIQVSEKLGIKDLPEPEPAPVGGLEGEAPLDDEIPF